MKQFIMSIAVLYALALSSDIAESKANEYCFKKEKSSPFLRLKELKEEYHFKKENVVYLSDEYKYCKWGSMGTYAEVRLDENLVLQISYGSFTLYNYEKKYDSIFVSVPSEFYCYMSDETSFASGRKCGEKNVSEEVPERECEDGKNPIPVERGREYKDIFLPILKKSIGKTFTVEIVVEAECPSNANDTNYSEKKSIKINRPIAIIGECTK